MFEDMYRRPGEGPDATDAVQQALPAASNLTSGLTICSNLASFDALLTTNDCLIAMFTMENCPPCRTIKPVFEDLAGQYSMQTVSSDTPTLFRKAFKKVAFALIDTNLASAVSSKFNVRSTPTFVFFLQGKEMNRFSGADRAELSSQMNLLLYECYRRVY